MRVFAILLIFFGMGNAWAIDPPSEAQLAAAISKEIPGYWKVEEVKITEAANRGDAVEPLWAQRFEASVSAKEDLYVVSDKDLSELMPFIGLERSVSAKAQEVLHGVAQSSLKAGQWQTKLTMENRLADGRSRAQFGDHSFVVSDVSVERIRKRRDAYFAELSPMIAIKGGCFQMGSPRSEEGRRKDEHQHEVCVEDFEIGKFEVTQAMWQAVMGSNPRHYKGDNRPVEQVSWNDVQDFIGKLNEKTGHQYRLPTEAEWEYAARAGSTTAYPWGDDIGRNKANCDGCGSRWDDREAAPVGSFAPNAWGLYDTVGNAWEWTCSRYDRAYSGRESRCAPQDDPGRRVIRGGSWAHAPEGVRSAYRSKFSTGYRNPGFGFRLSRTN